MKRFLSALVAGWRAFLSALRPAPIIEAVEVLPPVVVEPVRIPVIPRMPGAPPCVVVTPDGVEHPKRGLADAVTFWRANPGSELFALGKSKGVS